MILPKKSRAPAETRRGMPKPRTGAKAGGAGSLLNYLIGAFGGANHRSTLAYCPQPRMPLSFSIINVLASFGDYQNNQMEPI
jgi:hypothetical protein